MSLINLYRSTEKALKALQSKLELLNESPALIKEVEFESALRQLMAAHGKSLPDVIEVLDPTRRLTTLPRGVRQPRKLKVYRNPHTGEVIETKGGNHTQLKGWKIQHGARTVEGWLTH